MLDNWCFANKLDLNVEKCKVITFSRKRKTDHYSYFIDNKELCRVDFIIDLGIGMDVKLLFIKHYEVMLARASKIFGFVKRRAKEFNNIWVTKSLFCSFVRSILEYGSLIWDPISSNHKKSIESIQKQFLLFALRDQYNPQDFDSLPSYEFRLGLLNLRPLSLRRTINTLSFTHDVLSRKIDVEFINNKIVIHEPERTIRNPRFLKEVLHRTDYGKHEPMNRCCVTFNLFSHLYNPGDSKKHFLSLVYLQNN